MKQQPLIVTMTIFVSFYLSSISSQQERKNILYMQFIFVLRKQAAAASTATRANKLPPDQKSSEYGIRRTAKSAHTNQSVGILHKKINGSRAIVRLVCFSIGPKKLDNCSQGEKKPPRNFSLQRSRLRLSPSFGKIVQKRDGGDICREKLLLSCGGEKKF